MEGEIAQSDIALDERTTKFLNMTHNLGGRKQKQVPFMIRGLKP